MNPEAEDARGGRRTGDWLNETDPRYSSDQLYDNRQAKPEPGAA